MIRYASEYSKLQDLKKEHRDAFIYLAKKILYIKVPEQVPAILISWRLLALDGTTTDEIKAIISNAIADPHTLTLQDPARPRCYCVIL
jgi:hypothetical protein